MIDVFLKSISDVIYKEFKINVYLDEVRQGLKKPCFFIRDINISQKAGFSDRKRRNHLVSITYFPKNELSAIKEINPVSDLLYEILESVPFGDTTKSIGAVNMSHVISDGILVFTVSYSFHITKKKDKIYMDNLKYNGGIKNGK